MKFASSVRGKLIGIVLMTTLLVLLICGVALLVHDLAVYRTSWASDIASEASVLAMSSAPALAFDDRAAAEGNLQALRARPALLAAALYSADRKVYARFHQPGEQDAPDAPPAGLSGLRISGEQVEFVQPIQFRGEALGELYVRARYDVWGRVRAYLGIFAVITALSLVAALTLSSLVQRFITVPIEDIGFVARRIVENHDYSLRVHRRTDDEIGIVVRALNNMLNEVEARTRALEQSNAALQEADRRKDEFLATLAHELRNPLAPIRQATQILGSPVADVSQLNWAREVIARQVGHMALLLDDLLDVARITRGKLVLKKEPVPLERIIVGAVETTRPLLDARRHELIVVLPEERMELHVDSLRLSQVVANLLGNAAKYTDPAGRITVRAVVENGALLIAVSDTGIGLSETAIGSIFQMFSQVEGVLERSQGGLGIGLALVKGLVELHGGSVEARSDGLGQGSTFTVRLPLSAISTSGCDAAPG